MLVRREAGKASGLAQNSPPKGGCGPRHEGWLLSRATRPPDPVEGRYSAKPSSATNHTL
jgi:hypothetical protein